MQSPCTVACEHFSTSFRRSFFGLNFGTGRTRSINVTNRSDRGALSVSCGYGGSSRKWKSSKKLVNEKAKEGLRKGKENVWSADNEMVERDKEGKGEKRGKRRVKSVRRRRSGGGGGDGRVVVSGAMLVEIETVLQTQEPVVKPSWATFVSSVSGIWKGVGAVFSPITAEMEPVDVGSKSEYLYDFYTYSRVALVPAGSGANGSKIQRVIHWVTLNPDGELQKKNGKGNVDAVVTYLMPNYESYDFAKSDVMEEDIMGIEPGLVYFEVFEVSATPIFGADASLEESNSSDIPYVYLCTLTIKKRSLPDNPVHFGEEEMLDMRDATILWLPGGVTAYVDVDKDGTLCIGLGWYSDEGINLVMERDYGTDGKLKKVRWKSEVKIMWSDQIQA